VMFRPKMLATLSLVRHLAKLIIIPLRN